MLTEEEFEMRYQKFELGAWITGMIIIEFVLFIGWVGLWVNGKTNFSFNFVMSLAVLIPIGIIYKASKDLSELVSKEKND